RRLHRRPRCDGGIVPAGAVTGISAVPGGLEAGGFRRAADRHAAGAPSGHTRPLALQYPGTPAGFMSERQLEALLSLRGVSKTFGGVRALSDVSIEVFPRQIVGVIGPNGAGKTSLFNVITGAYRASSGDVVLDGHTITQEPS